ncbi:MAG: hypothetical protein K2F96_01735 [Muribaculaceae bacterium]|nr:hypothetical protein [Muribaculaceae bacterium]
MRNHLPDSKENTAGSFYGSVESARHDLPPNDTIGRRVISSFLKTPRVAAGSSPEEDERNIRNWAFMLVYKGNTALTVRRYLGRLKSLYEEYTADSSTDCCFFDILRKKISDIDSSRFDKTHEGIKALKKIARQNSCDQPELNKILLYQFYSCNPDLSSIISLKLNDPIDDIVQIQEIFSQIPTARKSYVFNVNRHNRPMQQVRQLSESLTELLNNYGCKLNGIGEDELIRTSWISAAINIGIPAEKIRGIIQPLPYSMKWLDIVNPVEVSDMERIDILQRVADYIDPTTPRWFALFMRNCNTPEIIKEKLENTMPALLKSTHFFFPTRKVFEKNGGKLRSYDEPFIPHILFFRTRPDKVRLIVHSVGELAWCFKTANKADAPYASIPNSEMELFQRVIGINDKTLNVECLTNPELVPERKVIVTGGVFKGYKGTIYKLKRKSTNGDLRIFTIRLNEDYEIKWEVSIEECFLETID